MPMPWLQHRRPTSAPLERRLPSHHRGLSVTASYASTLLAAQTVAASQHYPQGALYVVATPIGNLADISLRAMHVLALADSIACEDTRHAGTLLRSYGIHKEPSQWLALHEHNEAQACSGVIQRLREGQRVALISDAGTPAISDPGGRLVAAVRSAGCPVIPIPGASSVTAALSIAGLAPVAGAASGFLFVGFLPTRATERDAVLRVLALESRAMVLLEAPHRIEELALALAARLGQRPLMVARELTKQFEETTTLAAENFPAWLAERPQRRKGEFVLVLHGQPPVADPEPSLRVLKLLLAELPLKTAVKLAVEITGGSRNELYAAALAARGEEPSSTA